MRVPSRSFLRVCASASLASNMSIHVLSGEWGSTVEVEVIRDLRACDASPSRLWLGSRDLLQFVT